MKTKTLSSLVLSSLILAHANISSADDTEKMSKKETVASGKGAALFTSGAVAGAIAGGPVGAIVGAIGGAFIGEDLKKGARDADALEVKQQELAAYEIELTEREQRIANLEQAASQRLEFQVMFTTGKDTLTHNDKQRLDSLATYLEKNPQLKVRLDGHADPRGTNEFNNLLSEDRAMAVITALEAHGIDKNRISFKAHGAGQSTANEGDYEAYALERKVNIEVFAEEASFAAN